MRAAYESIKVNGSVLKTQSVAEGGQASAPVNPSRTGYTFSGWDGDFANITSDTEITAKFTINSYTISFNSTGGSQVASKSANYNTLISMPANPTRSGYKFVGWYTTSAYSTIFNFNTNITENRTLYARWIASSTTGLKAVSNGYNSNKLTWTATPGANYYQIFRVTSTTGVYTLIETQSSASTTYINTGLATGTTYYYKIKAYAAIGVNKVYSEYSLVAYAKPVPAAPAGLKSASASYNSIRLTWTAVTGANGYYIYRSTSSAGPYSLVATVTTAYYTNTSLITGKIYYYKVIAYRLAGTTKVSGSASIITNTKAIPSTIGTLSPVPYSATSIKVSWSAISGATGYEIFRSTASAGIYSMIKSQTAISFINTGLVTGRYYYYKVRSYRLVGTTKIYSSFSVIKYTKT